MAISFDSAASQSQDASATSTFSLTVSGSNRLLIVGVQVGVGNTISGVTYSGVSMTQINTQGSVGATFGNFYLFRLVAPATGANNVVITASGVTFIYGSAASYTGVDQVNPIDVSNTFTSTTAGTFSESLTTTVANDWLIAYVGLGGGNNSGNSIVAGSATTRRTTDPGVGGWYSFFDSNATVAIGSNALNFDTTGYTLPTFGINMTSIRPVATTVTSGFFWAAAR